MGFVCWVPDKDEIPVGPALEVRIRIIQNIQPISVTLKVVAKRVLMVMIYLLSTDAGKIRCCKKYREREKIR